MAFLKGSQIRPELGRADFSPIERGGMAMGNAYASIGGSLAQGIGTAVQQHRQKKAEKEQVDAFANWMEQRGFATGEEATAAAKAVGVTNAVQFMSQWDAKESQARNQIGNQLAAMNAWQRSDKDPETGLPKVGSVYKLFAERGGTDTEMLDEMLDNASKSAGVTVNVGNQPSVADQEASNRLQQRINKLNEISEQGWDAEQLAAEAGRAINLIEGGARTGFGQGFEVTAKQALGALGVETDVASMEELNRLLGNQVMARVGQTKGSVSEREMKLFREYSAAPEKTPEGNLAIMRSVQRQAARAQEMAKIVDDGRAEGKSSAEIQKEVIEYRDNNPLFPKDILSADDPYKALEQTLAPLVRDSAQANPSPKPQVPVDDEAGLIFNKLFNPPQ